MENSILSTLQNFPQAIQNEVNQQWVLFCTQHAKIVDALIQHPQFMSTVAKVWAFSCFVLEYSQRNPDGLLNLFNSQDILSPANFNYYQQMLTDLFSECNTESQLKLKLRQFRNQQMVRIAWRNLAGWSTLTETLDELTYLADVCIALTSEKLYQIYRYKFGKPVDSFGNPQSLLIIAVGKLGGHELNFSSDVDLIFAYDKNGETIGANNSIDNQTFFTRLTQTLINVLNDITEGGFVLRVDARLRPFGNTGPLVMNYAAMEIYYQAHGREWERYALIKARLISSGYGAERFKKMIQRFVYRRYVDYGVIDALRDMKQLMDRETRQRSLENNIKRGAGGIREIEFIVQALQLTRGGRETFLQNTSLLQSLYLLQKHQCLENAVVQELMDAYFFLRDTENRLQIFKDKQTQTLPSDALQQLRLAISMGFESYEEFYSTMVKHRKKVRKHFAVMIASPHTKQQQTNLPQKFLDDLKAVWLGTVDLERTKIIFNLIGYVGQAEMIIERLERFRNCHRLKLISSVARKRLDELFPYLLCQILKCKNAPITLGRVINVLDAIVRRSAYLSMLIENPLILYRFVNFCSQSALIAKQLAHSPLLLDELLGELDTNVLQLNELKEDLNRRFLSIVEDDVEEQIECLQQFKQIQTLKVAAADIMGVNPVIEVSDSLSNIATTLLNQSLIMVYQALVKQYGYLTMGSEAQSVPPFLIVAYGKLGGIELGYNSDLDLVFLYQEEGVYYSPGPRCITYHEYYSKLAQRLINLLSMQTSHGELYKIDLKLRPLGDAGLLVTTLDSFYDYQLQRAWIWEHQALVRARAVAGPACLIQRFDEMRHTILTQPREDYSLKNQIVEMRQRMQKRDQKKNLSGLDIKQCQGGVTDIEFMVQYCVLRWAHRYPQLTQYTDNGRILKELGLLELMPINACEGLITAYRIYRALIHKFALQDELPLIAENELSEYRDHVVSVWESLFHTDALNKEAS